MFASDITERALAGMPHFSLLTIPNICYNPDNELNGGAKVSRRITPDEIRSNEKIKTYIKSADGVLVALGYTEHSFAHVVKCAETASSLLRSLGRDERLCELAWIAGYMHDIGNLVNREQHAQSGAIIAMQLLSSLDMEPADVAEIVAAIGSHDEYEVATPISDVSAALILADKTDVRRSRVRSSDTISLDIHDRVNYAAVSSNVALDVAEKTFALELEIDTTICPVMEYFEIFLQRMLLSRKAADRLGLVFKLVINGQTML